MITESDLIMLVLACLIGYIDDINSPQAYHYENQIVMVDKKYQCPTYCGVNHNHFVYFEGKSTGIVIEKSLLGKKVKQKKITKKNKR